jgi:hypothetical protein
MKDALGGSWSRRALACALGFALSFAAVNACSPSSGDAGEDGTSQGPGSGNGASGQGGSGNGSSASQASGNGGGISIGSGAAGGSSGVGGACAAVSSEAKPGIQPADIIIAVDTSGSMDEESGEVQDNLNQFASIITNSGIDVHVVLIADGSVCIPAPLGSGSCPADEALPAYRHVQQTVNSTDGLQVILSTYPQWSASLRPGATRTVAIVSDDNSDMSANDFVSQLVALDPSFQGFKFDAIVASSDPFDCFAGCLSSCATCLNPCCNKAAFCIPLSAAKGSVYHSLVTQTMGVLGDLCAQDFDPVFQSMATGVITGSQVSCALDIPPPDGGMLDPGKVNVKYTPGGGNPSSILNVPGGAAACTAQGGWYYDDPQNPTQIVLCPATCTVVQADPEAKIDVLFGCETEVVPPA